MNRYLDEMIRAAFRAQDQAAAPELARRMFLRRFPLPSDSDVTALYHESLAEACQAISNEIADAQTDADLDVALRRKAEALEFLIEYRPYSPRRAHRRPDHYWAAFDAWTAAVQAALTGFPKNLVPESIRRDLAFYRGWASTARLDAGYGWVAEKLAFSALWALRCEGALFKTFTWKRLSPVGVAAYAVPGRILLVHYRDAALLRGEVTRGALYVRGESDVRLLDGAGAEEELASLNREARALPVDAPPPPPCPTFEKEAQ
jgi:hypothetical protein